MISTDYCFDASGVDIAGNDDSMAVGKKIIRRLGEPLTP
jgi:hypothetical protein